MTVQFRENWHTRCVEVFENGVVVYSDPEYRGAAIWAKEKYNLSDDELMVIYRDYKNDYDNY